jgi:asparagine synthase (glutamine-hydrolysing)
MESFIAIIPLSPEQGPSVVQKRRGKADACGMTIRQDRPFFLATSENLPLMRCGDALVLGSIFATDKSDPAHLPPDFAQAVDEPALRRIFRDYWGNFIAIMPDADRHGYHILRSPFGRLPCFHSRQHDRLFVASDMEAMAMAGWTRRGVAWTDIARRLALRDIPADRTCLEGIQELRGGSCLHVSPDSIRLNRIWSPWAQAGRRHWIDNREKAAGLVRQAVSTATRGSTLGSQRAIVLLSGGLDSSVLAASLSTHGCPYDSLNLSSQGGVGDERAFARMVASRLRIPQIEARWEVDMVDLTRSDAHGQPNPITRSFMQGTTKLLQEAVCRTGADLTLDGGGGDNVFFALRSVAPVADALRRGGSLTEAVATALSIARLAEVGVGTVLRRAAARIFRRSPVFRWPVETSFLAPEIIDDSALVPNHPWLEPPRDAEAGTAAHIAMIVAAQGWAESCDLLSPVRHMTPLASQPVVEACLKIPSWWWYRDGQNRIVARDAFRDRLPAEILDRRVKGTPDSYVAQIYEGTRLLIRAMLLDGALRRAGLIDVPRLERALDAEGIVQGTDYLRIMQLVDVEAWIAGQS